MKERLDGHHDCVHCPQGANAVPILGVFLYRIEATESCCMSVTS